MSLERFFCHTDAPVGPLANLLDGVDADAAYHTEVRGAGEELRSAITLVALALFEDATLGGGSAASEIRTARALALESSERAMERLERISSRARNHHRFVHLQRARDCLVFALPKDRTQRCRSERAAATEYVDQAWRELGRGLGEPQVAGLISCGPCCVTAPLFLPQQQA